MNYLSFLRSAGVGILISLFAASSFSIVKITLDAYSAWALSISIATFLSLIFMVRKNGLKKGGFSLLVCYLASSLVVLLISPSIAVLAIFNTLWLWITRTVLWHKHAISSVGDLVLSVGSLFIAFAVGAHTQSVFMSFWSFFLAQALIAPTLSFCRQQLSGKNDIVPSYIARTTDNKTQFDQARRSAERALRLLKHQADN